MLRRLSPGLHIPHPLVQRLRRPRRRSKKSERHLQRPTMLRLLNPGLHRLLLPGHRCRRLLRLNNRTSRRAVKNMSPQRVSPPQSHDRSVRSPFISVSVPSGGDNSGRGSNGDQIVAPAFTRRSGRTASVFGNVDDNIFLGFHIVFFASVLNLELCFSGRKDLCVGQLIVVQSPNSLLIVQVSDFPVVGTLP